VTGQEAPLAEERSAFRSNATRRTSASSPAPVEHERHALDDSEESNVVRGYN
jgi:hypothetical protein